MRITAKFFKHTHTLTHLTGIRSGISEVDLSSVIPEEVEEEVRSAAEISMGTEISEEDWSNICQLCDQVIEISEYRTELYEYIKNRMLAIAPNLTLMVGELVGARLIAHAGEKRSNTFIVDIENYWIFWVFKLLQVLY